MMHASRKEVLGTISLYYIHLKGSRQIQPLLFVINSVTRLLPVFLQLLKRMVTAHCTARLFSIILYETGAAVETFALSHVQHVIYMCVSLYFHIGLVQHMFQYGDHVHKNQGNPIWLGNSIA